MKLQLKNVKVSKRFSEETTAFTASLHVDGKKAADVRNDGRGGSHRIYFAEPAVRDAVEAWARSQPDVDLGEGLVVKSDLDLVVTLLLEAHL